MPVTFAVENHPWQLVCKGDYREKDVDYRWTVALCCERGSGAKVDRSRCDFSISDLFQMV
jgi:hypothetical protein